VGSYDEFVEKVRYHFPEREYYKYGRIGFATPSGRVELYSQTLKELGYEPMPTYAGPAENENDNPDLAERFPLTLIAGGGFMPFYHSEHRQIKPLRFLHHQPLVQINPATARELGIREGDWVWIETLRGRIKQVATLTEAVHTRTICTERGGSRNAKGRTPACTIYGNPIATYLRPGRRSSATRKAAAGRTGGYCAGYTKSKGRISHEPLDNGYRPAALHRLPFVHHCLSGRKQTAHRHVLEPGYHRGAERQVSDPGLLSYPAPLFPLR
jgi:anaerobic selenocysteine-containing dehydrogenase